MRFSLRWYSKSGRIWQAILTLLLIFTAYTIVYFSGLTDSIKDYSLAGLDFLPEETSLHAFYIYRPSGLIPSSAYNVISNLMLDFFFPLILAFYYIDIEHKHRKVQMSSVLISRGGKSIIGKEFCVVFLLSFLTLFLSLLYQVILGRIFDVVFQPLGYIESISTASIGLIISSSAKVSLYFASLTTVGYSVGLYLNRLFPLAYIIPMLVNIVLAMIFRFSRPSKLGFIEDGLNWSNPQLLPVVIIAILLASAGLMVPRICRTDEL